MEMAGYKLCTGGRSVFYPEMTIFQVIKPVIINPQQIQHPTRSQENPYGGRPNN